MQTRILPTALLGALLAGCSLAPGPYIDNTRLNQTQQAVPAADSYPVTPIDVAYFAELRATAKPSVCPLTCLTSAERKNYDYHVGINDQLTVIVWDHPELTGGTGGIASLPPIPQGAAGGSTPGNTTGPQGSTLAAITPGTGGESGLAVRVARDGTIYFPRVGRVNVAGKTTQQVQEILTRGLAKTIRNPQLDVRVSGFNSQIVQVTGNVKNPTPESITDLPLSVLDAINRAGGAQTDADLQNVGLTRDGKRYTIDVAALLESGDPNQNVILKDGDLIDIPDRSNSRVFVLGEVAKPTSLPMNRGKLTLADALTGASGLDVRTGDPRFIYVIRGMEEVIKQSGTPDANQAATTQAAAKPGTVRTSLTPGLAQNPAGAAPSGPLEQHKLLPLVYRLDMTQVDALMLMTKFELLPKDVVYVQVAASARFNRLLDQITPTLQTLFFTKALVD